MTTKEIEAFKVENYGSIIDELDCNLFYESDFLKLLKTVCDDVDDNAIILAIIRPRDASDPSCIPCFYYKGYAVTLSLRNQRFVRFKEKNINVAKQSSLRIYVKDSKFDYNEGGIPGNTFTDYGHDVLEFMLTDKINYARILTYSGVKEQDLDLEKNYAGLEVKKRFNLSNALMYKKNGLSLSGYIFTFVDRIEYR